MEDVTDLVWSNAKRKVNDLIPFEGNPRFLTEKQAVDLEKSLRRFNYVEPAAINLNGKIVAGHQRLKILQLLGRGEEEVDVRIPNRLLTEDEELEYLLRSNKNTGEWDPDALANFNEELLMEVGFTPAQLDNIFELEIGKDDDAIPEVRKSDPPKAERGRIYSLGAHRLMCGDSTSPEDLAKLMGSQKADLLFTDPPYNVNYAGKGKNTSEGIANDDLTKEEFDAFIDKTFRNVFEFMRDGAVFYICSGWSSYPTFNEKLIGAGFYRAGVIILVKNNASYGWNDYRYKHEWILVGKKKQERIKGVSILYGWKEGGHYFRDTRDEYDVWEVPRAHSAKYVHPTQKPVWLVSKAIANSSSRGEAVLDLFAGSGSTLISCERLKRRAYLMEYDPHYVDVIIERYCNMTGANKEEIYSNFHYQSRETAGEGE